MIHLLIRRIPHEVISARNSKYQLLKHFSSGITKNVTAAVSSAKVSSKVATATAATVSDTTNENEDAKNPQVLVEALAIPVATTPTIDSSLRSALESKKPNVTKNENEKTKRATKITHLEWLPAPGERWSIYKKLAKFRLTSLVVATAMGGYALAPAPFELSTFLLCAVGTGLVSAAANAINQVKEVPYDAQMARTKNRVLVIGRVTPLYAVTFAFVCATSGILMLNYGVNGLTAALGAGNLILYTSIYTPLKRKSILNTWVGSVVGAIPPLMGCASCSGTLDAGAWILAGLLYAWQFPHFNALSWNLRPDYLRAGYRMMAVENPGLCRRTALRYTLMIMGLSCLAPMLDVTNVWFPLETLPLNAYFIYLAYKFYENADSKSSRTLFRFSLIHLPALIILFLLNKKRWYFADDTEITAATELITTTTTNKTTEALNVVDKTGELLQLPTAPTLGNLLSVTRAATPEVSAAAPVIVPSNNKRLEIELPQV